VGLTDWPLWAAAVFLVLLLYRAQPIIGGWVLILLAISALILLHSKGGLS
jgi:hypothetical protein